MGSSYLVVIGRRFKIVDSQGLVVGSIRRAALGSSSSLTIGGARYVLRVAKRGRRAVLEDGGSVPVELKGDVDRQRYELKRGAVYVARVLNYGVEPDRTFIVELLSDDEPLALICMVVMVELHARPHLGRAQDLRDLAEFP